MSYSVTANWLRVKTGLQDCSPSNGHQGDRHAPLHTHYISSSINNKWKEKSSVIGQLEDQVQQMKTSWQAREKKLTEERDKSLDAAR